MVGRNYDYAATSELEVDLACDVEGPVALAASRGAKKGRLQAGAFGRDGASSLDDRAPGGAQEEAAPYGGGVFRIGELIAKLEKKYKM